mmetsp:Transcript_651/g.1620  ORF Transcript_651/g.1620 Transcript_651/m.1620 type:complete len:100 (+) Transcript_651:351-650(+)
MLAHLDELLLQLIRDMASSGAPQAALRLLQRSIWRYQQVMRAADMDALRPFMQQADQSTMATWSAMPRGKQEEMRDYSEWWIQARARSGWACAWGGLTW